MVACISNTVKSNRLVVRTLRTASHAIRKSWKHRQYQRLIDRDACKGSHSRAVRDRSFSWSGNSRGCCLPPISSVDKAASLDLCPKGKIWGDACIVDAVG